MAETEIAISLRGIVNRFGKQVVHDNLDLDVRRGQLLASTTVMNLAGQGGMARGLRMTAGLRSTVRLVRESSPR